MERVPRAPAWVAFDTVSDLRLLDLTGTWPTRAGASMAINTGRRDRARRWSQAMYAAFPNVDGLWYPSSMYANQPCVALYERAQASLPRNPVFHRLLADPAVLRRLKGACVAVNYVLL
ncbi:MAG: RES domain-containing protein [Myxococcota bacterium]